MFSKKCRLDKVARITKSVQEEESFVFIDIDLENTNASAAPAFTGRIVTGDISTVDTSPSTS